MNSIRNAMELEFKNSAEFWEFAGNQESQVKKKNGDELEKVSQDPLFFIFAAFQEKFAGFSAMDTGMCVVGSGKEYMQYEE